MTLDELKATLDQDGPPQGLSDEVRPTCETSLEAEWDEIAGTLLES